MHVRLGDLLVRGGALTEEQRDQILERQREVHTPFGVLAEEMFGVEPSVIERAWAEQYAARAERVDPNFHEPSDEVLGVVDRRQAWQFAILPLERRGGELICCTTPEHLPRALRFAGWKLGDDVSFVVTDREKLGSALATWYPMGGASADDLLPAEAMPSP